MVYQAEDMAKDVRVCIDQNMSSESLALEGDVDTLSVDEIIASKLADAARAVHKAAPAWMLEAGHNIEAGVHWADQCSGWVLLPHDFMRLIRFKMSDWERSVETAIAETDPRYALQRQRVKALRGTAQKPVAAIVHRPEGLALEFYSCKSEDAWVEIGQYAPYPEVDRMGGIDISERCYRAAVHMAAALTLATFGEAEKAAAMEQKAQMLLQ